MRAKCRLCAKTASTTSRNMETHYRNFLHVKRAIDALITMDTYKSYSAIEGDKSQPSVISNSSRCKVKRPLSNLVTHPMTNSNKTELNLLFSCNTREYNCFQFL